MTGFRPRPTASGKLRSSIPPENETGRRSPNTLRKRATSAIASGCSGGPGEVHHSLARRKEAPVVLDHQRVGELHAEAAAASRGEGGEAFDHIDDLGPFRVLVVDPFGDLDVVVAERAVQDGFDLVAAEQGRIELDDDVEADLADEVPDDRLDLARRAAVEGRERQRVGDAGRKRQVAELAP